MFLLLCFPIFFFFFFNSRVFLAQLYVKHNNRDSVNFKLPYTMSQEPFFNLFFMPSASHGHIQIRICHFDSLFVMVIQFKLMKAVLAKYSGEMFLLKWKIVSNLNQDGIPNSSKIPCDNHVRWTNYKCIGLDLSLRW